MVKEELGSLHVRARQKQNKVISCWQGFRWLKHADGAGETNLFVKYMFCEHEDLSVSYNPPPHTHIKSLAWRWGVGVCTCDLTAREEVGPDPPRSAAQTSSPAHMVNSATHIDTKRGQTHEECHARLFS